MAAPAVYSEVLFAEYLVSQIDPVASALGWDAGSPQALEAVNDALLDLSVSDIASVTDIRGLRAVGQRAIWKAVMDATAGNYDFIDVAQQRFSRSQVHEQAEKNFNRADHDCQLLGVGISANAQRVHIARVVRPNDPYIVIPDSERLA